MAAKITAARSGRHHDSVAIGEFVGAFFEKRARVFSIAAVESGLTAAGLFFRDRDRRPGRARQIGAGGGDTRAHQADKASGENADAHHDGATTGGDFADCICGGDFC